MRHYVGYGALAAALLIGSYLWHKSDVAIARAEERVRAQDAVIESAKEAIAASERDRKQAISELESARSRPATVQTVTKYLPMPLPPGSEVKIEKLADAAAPQIVLTGDAGKNLQAIQEMEIAHKECDVNLKSCSEKSAAGQQQIAALIKERDTWKETAKGGSRFHRLGKALKIVGCAGGGAALGSVLSSSQFGKPRGAAIGGAAGAGACQVLF
jgi:hypothetical protein